VAEMLRREAAAQGASSALEAELAKVRAEYEARIEHMELTHKTAMERQVIELTGTADQIAALRDEKSKEERIELLRRQVGRRIANADLTRGWGAWHELWMAKSYALKRLWQVGNKLRCPAINDMWLFWSHAVSEKKAKLERERLEREANSLEAQLRRARFEAGQLQLVRVAHEDEIRALSAQLSEIKADAFDADTGESSVPAMRAQVDELRAKLAVLTEDANTATRLRKEAEDDAERNSEDNKRLLEKLLRDQRRKFEAELDSIRKQGKAAAKKTEEEERNARIELLRRQVGRRMMNADISRGWSAWLEMYDARVYALSRLNAAAARLAKPELSVFFSFWNRLVYAAKQKEQAAAAENAELDLINKARRCETVEAELKKTKKEVGDLKDEQLRLREKLNELDGGFAEAERRQEELLEKEREERVELLRRQSMRRMANRDLACGWAAWFELYEARKYALEGIRRVAKRLKAPALSDTFDGWSESMRQEKYMHTLLEEKKRANKIRLGVEGLAQELEESKAAYEHRIATLEDRLANSEMQLSVVSGSRQEIEASAARQEAMEKEARVELLTRQIARRIKNADLAKGWSAWQEMYEAKVYAHNRLRQAANRLKSPAVLDTFESWASMMAEQKRIAGLADMLRQQAGLQGEAEKLEAELKSVRDEYEAKLTQQESQHKKALERQLLELTGSADQLMALQEEKEKEGRVELLRRQVTRRIMNSGISRGFTAWVELWEAKAYAIRRLREVGNKLRAPEVSVMFGYWGDECAEAKRLAERERLEREANSLEAQLRRARFEAGQQRLVVVAHEDEIMALKERLGMLNDEVVDRESGLRYVPDLRVENAELRAAKDEASERAELAERLRLEAEEDIKQERIEQEKLLQRLLSEQRRHLEGEIADLKNQILAHTDEYEKKAGGRAQLEMTISQLKREIAALERKSREEEATFQREREGLNASIQGLNASLEEEKEKAKIKAKPKPKPTPPPEKKKKTSPLGDLDLDEGPDAPPISQQLAAALRKSAGKVLDLFRNWDDNGDGEVSRAEFHKAMPALGLNVPKKDIDDLFTEWDSDGGGAIGYKEMQKILRSKPTQVVVEKVETAKGAMTAITRMQGDVKKSKLGLLDKLKAGRNSPKRESSSPKSGSRPNSASGT